MTSRPAWYLSSKFRAVVLTIFAIAAVGEGVIAVFYRLNDFAVHLEWGRQFLAGGPTASSLAQYPLGRWLFNGSLALLGKYGSRAFCYALALASLAASFRMWERIAAVRRPVIGPVSFVAAAATLGLLYPYVIRDLDDCGLQLLLLFLLTAAAYCVVRGRRAQAGFWLALGTTYKVMPILFLPLLLWKRQWRAAWSMVGFTVALNLAPAAFIGWDATIDYNRRFLTNIRAGVGVDDPSRNAVEPPRHQNQGLQMALARYLQTHPETHPLYLNHPAFAQFGSLSAKTAKRTVLVILLAFAGVLAWRFRRRWGPGRDESDLAREWPVVCILCALLSPLCWLQHLVLALPGLFLVLRDLFGNHQMRLPLSRPRLAAVAIVGGIVLLLQRDVVQRELSILVLSYKFDTFAMLLVLALTATLPNRYRDAIGAGARPAFDRQAA